MLRSHLFHTAVPVASRAPHPSPTPPTPSHPEPFLSHLSWQHSPAQAAGYTGALCAGGALDSKGRLPPLLAMQKAASTSSTSSAPPATLPATMPAIAPVPSASEEDGSGAASAGGAAGGGGGGEGAQMSSTAKGLSSG